MADPHATAREPVRVEVNERGTPYLYFPEDDDGHVGEGCREATVAEWRFWRERESLAADLAAANQRAETAERERDEALAALRDELDNWNPEARPTISAELARVRAERDTLRETLDIVGLSGPWYGNCGEALSWKRYEDIARAALASVSAEENTRQDTETTAGESART